MKSPLDQFAERIVRNNEVGEFIFGLVIEHQVDPNYIHNILDEIEKQKEENQLTSKIMAEVRLP